MGVGSNMTQTKNAIEVFGLVKSFPKGRDQQTVAVKNINITVPQGQITSIMGPSGCGKSVLMKMLGGIILPTDGRIVLEGREYLHGIPKNELRRIGFVFQKDNLQPWRTVEKNLMLPIEVMRLKGEEWKNRVGEMLELVGLNDYRHALPQELSGGMKQRVALVRALMHNPDIVLMDQPFGALDAITRRMLTYEFINIWKKTGKTFLMVTNDIDEALLLSSKVYVLSRQPGTVINEQAVDIPYDRRNQEILLDDEFLHLKALLRHWTTYGTEGGLAQ